MESVEFHLPLGAVRGEQGDPVAPVLGGDSDAVDEAVHGRAIDTVDRRIEQQGDAHRALRAQGTSDGRGPVALGLDRGADAFACLRAHDLRVVDHVGDGLSGHASSPARLRRVGRVAFASGFMPTFFRLDRSSSRAPRPKTFRTVFDRPNPELQWFGVPWLVKDFRWTTGERVVDAAIFAGAPRGAPATNPAMTQDGRSPGRLIASPTAYQ